MDYGAAMLNRRPSHFYSTPSRDTAMHTDHHHEAQTDELEATELSSVVPGAEHLGFGADHSPEDAAHSSATAHCYDQSDVQAQQQHQRQQYWYDGIRRLWKHYVQLSVPRVDCRDHLANERTFLAYQRTSLALSMMGVITAQLFNLQRSSTTTITTTTHSPFGYFYLGKPLAALFQIVAMMVTVIGAHRFWRQQMNMARGKIWAGGWELYAIMGTMILLLGAIFGLLLAVDIEMEG